jgi:predicted RNA-binding protein with RPS1 domain
LALCFEITINDGPPVIAGVEDISVLTACLTFAASRNELELSAGGLVSKSPLDNEHLEWVQENLRIGDRVSIRIVDAPTPSLPISRRRQDPEASERAKRKYYEQLKSRFEPK